MMNELPDVAELFKILIAGSWDIPDGLMCCQRLLLFYPDKL
jgi:hypothetical protein